MVAVSLKNAVISQPATVPARGQTPGSQRKNRSDIHPFIDLAFMAPIEKPPLILLVEDTRTDEELTVRALRKAKVEAEIVVQRDGQQALDFLFGQGAYEGQERDVLPALIMLDMKLPKVDGIEVLTRIRADPRTRLVPTVILTSSSEQEVRLRGYEAGANSYVRKPVSVAQFTGAVGQLGIYWTLLNRDPSA